MGGYIIGLDYGTESARGVAIDVESGAVVADHTHPYRHGVMTERLPDGTPLPAAWALQNAPDYTEAAAAILERIGRGRVVHGIGIGFTASSPMPARADGEPLSVADPGEKHAYVKLWKHQAAQPWATRINEAGGDFLRPFGGKLSAEWLLPKAAEIEAQAPDVWARTDRFIEAGDWLVWQLTGQEARSAGFAAYKAQHAPGKGYPRGIVPGLETRLSEPVPVGRAAGTMTEEWRRRCGIEGAPKVAVTVIDSHILLPAVGATQPGTLVGALGTSAAYLLLDDEERPLPHGIEGVARDGVLPGFWCYESGQAGFGDTLAWFVRAFPLCEPLDDNFARYNAEAAKLRAGQCGLIALDWWNGCRVPYGDSLLNGMLVGMTLKTRGIDIYRALLESLCYGARSIADHLEAGGAPIKRIIMASGLTQNNPLLMQIMANVFGREISVPQIQNATAISAAIHGAVAGGVVAEYGEGARRFGAREFRSYRPDAAEAKVYEGLYRHYRALGESRSLREAMHALKG